MKLHKKTKRKSSSSSRKLAPKRISVAFGRNYFYPITGSEQGRPNEPSALPWKDGFPASIACSAQSTIVATEKGKVYMTGTMHGHVCPTWTRIEVPLPGKVTAVAAGRHFAVALTDRNAVVTWGAGHFGQLGVMVPTAETASPVTFSSRPILVDRLLHADSTIVKVAAGDWHGLAVTESGKVWAWGSNRSLQCGLSNQNGSSRSATTIPLPLPISQIPPMKDVVAGRSHTLALTQTQGRVYSWGHSTHGQCGTGIATRSKAGSNGSSVGLMPALVEGLPGSLDIKQISAAGHHSMALSKAGRVFSWGLGAEGELGLHTACRQPHTGSTSKPRLVSDLDFVAIAAAYIPSEEAADHLKNVPKVSWIQAGASYGTAVSTSGHLYCWGSNDVGQLGIPSNSVLPEKYHNYPGCKEEQPTEPPQIHVKTFDSNHNVLLPTRVETVDHIRVLSTACGPNHMWTFGEEPAPTDNPVIIGRTLHEVQTSETGIEHEQMFRESTETSTQTAKSIEEPTNSPLSPTVVSNCGGDISPPSQTDAETPSAPPQSAVGVFQFGAEQTPARGGEGRKGVMRRLSNKLLRRHSSNQQSDTSVSANGGSNHSRSGESKFFGRFQNKQS